MVLFYMLLLCFPLSVLAVAFRNPRKLAMNEFSRIRFQGSLPSESKDNDITTISRLHIIVLVHGWLGNPKEMDYLKHTLSQQLLQESKTSNTNLSTSSNPTIAVAIPTQNSKSYEAFVIHSAESNSGSILTSDGIAAGGQRVAQEIDRLVAHYSQFCHQRPITLSLVGNSLGGLYCRYAISRMQSFSKLTPKFFVTTCTPHLGVSQHTYLTIPIWMESLIATSMQQTGKDLFRRSLILQDMILDQNFVQPLLAFQHRIAYANMYGTDFQVPTSTAAFWADTDSIHHVVARQGGNHNKDNKNNIVLQLTTPQTEIQNKNTITTTNDLSSKDMSVRLDQLGWTKVLVDVREHLPFNWRRSTSFAKSSDDDASKAETSELFTTQTTWTARELLQDFDKGHFQSFPLGHTVMVANAKDSLNRYLTKGGQSTMDHLACTMIQTLLKENNP